MQIARPDSTEMRRSRIIQELSKVVVELRTPAGLNRVGTVGKLRAQSSRDRLRV